MEDYDDRKHPDSDMPARAAKKQRVTLYLDPAILEAFRAQAAHRQLGYQTLINDNLRQVIHPDCAPLTVESMRRILREELGKYCPSRQAADEK